MESPVVPDTAAAKTRGARDVLVRSALHLKVFAYEQRAPERFCLSRRRLQTVCSDTHTELLRTNPYAASSQPSFTQIRLRERDLTQPGCLGALPRGYRGDARGWEEVFWKAHTSSKLCCPPCPCCLPCLRCPPCPQRGGGRQAASVPRLSVAPSKKPDTNTKPKAG